MHKRFVFLALMMVLMGCAGGQKGVKQEDIAGRKEIERLEKRLERDSTDYQTYFDLGQLFILQGDTARGLASLDSCLRLNDTFGEALFLKGRVLFWQEKRTPALEAFLRLLETDTSQAMAQKIAGVIGMLYPVRRVRTSDYEDANPVYSPDGNKIAFQSNQHHNWDIFVMNSKGGDLKQLTKHPLHEEFPVFADDHTLYFTRQQSADSRNRDIYRLNLDNLSQEVVIQNPADDWYPAPVPGSGTLVFVSDRPIEGNKNTKIMVFDAASKSVYPLVKAAHNFSSPTITPNGESLLFTEKNDGVYSLLKCSLDGSDPHQVSQLPLNVGAPSISPDGKQIAFFSRHKGNVDIYLLNIESGDLIRLTAEAGNDLSPGFSPDGKRLIFYSDRTTRYQIYEMNLETPVTRSQLIEQIRLFLKQSP